LRRIFHQLGPWEWVCFGGTKTFESINSMFANSSSMASLFKFYERTFKLNEKLTWKDPFLIFSVQYSQLQMPRSEQPIMDWNAISICTFVRILIYLHLQGTGRLWLAYGQCSKQGAGLNDEDIFTSKLLSTFLGRYCSSVASGDVFPTCEGKVPSYLL
jgi:hypothetical protein